MGARAELKAALVAELPESMHIIDDVRDLGEIDPAATAVLQLIRRKVEPGTRMSAFWQEFDLWVVEPKTAPEELEDLLDDTLDAVLEQLEQIKWLTWTAADREMHPSGYHGYRITIRTTSNTTS